MAKLTNRQIEVITRAVKEQIKLSVFTEERKAAIASQLKEENAEFLTNVEAFNEQVRKHLEIGRAQAESSSIVRNLSDLANNKNVSLTNCSVYANHYDIDKNIEKEVDKILNKELPSDDSIESLIILNDLSNSSTLVADILEQLGFSE